MLISGLQKLTLLDYPGRVACTVFTGGCNFRCPFCHNASLVLPEQMVQDTNEEEVLSFLKKRVGVLDGVAVTGGEPLLHKDIGAFLAKVKALGYSIKLDTNGSFPELLMELVREGLVDRVAMDIKNSPELYAHTVGLDKLDMAPIERSKEFLLTGTVEDYDRTLDLKTGETVRKVVWKAPNGRRYELCFRRFVSMERLHVIGQKLCVRPLDGEALLDIAGGIDGRMTNSGSQHFSEGDKRLFKGRHMQYSQTTGQSKIDFVFNTTFSFAWTARRARSPASSSSTAA